MDRDCVIAHGLNYFLNESMMVRGDEFYMAICNHSGTVAIYNERNNLFFMRAKTCVAREEFARRIAQILAIM